MLCQEHPQQQHQTGAGVIAEIQPGPTALAASTPSFPALLKRKPGSLGRLPNSFGFRSHTLGQDKTWAGLEDPTEKMTFDSDASLPQGKYMQRNNRTQKHNICYTAHNLPQTRTAARQEANGFL
ncbi:MAG TPA: hypothetical protein DCP71_06135 [Verrucomicrobiales bacterium]|nr:hypothetical protein [Verrucomicrobiales bacterium]